MIKIIFLNSGERLDCSITSVGIISYPFGGGE